jgi:hypothetical protein
VSQSELAHEQITLLTNISGVKNGPKEKKEKTTTTEIQKENQPQPTNHGGYRRIHYYRHDTASTAFLLPIKIVFGSSLTPFDRPEILQ